MQETSSQSANKLAQASRLIRYHAMGGGAVGLIPLPLIDFAVLTGIQVNLVRKLAALYGVPFSEEIGKSLVSALIGSSVPGAVFFGLTVTIPVFPVRILSVSAVSAGITFAVGKVFVQHFESGGTFLTFDPEKVREYFAREFRKGVTPREPNNTTDDSEEDYGGIMP